MTRFDNNINRTAERKIRTRDRRHFRALSILNFYTDYSGIDLPVTRDLSALQNVSDLWVIVDDINFIRLYNLKGVGE